MNISGPRISTKNEEVIKDHDGIEKRQTISYTIHNIHSKSKILIAVSKQNKIQTCSFLDPPPDMLLALVGVLGSGGLLIGEELDELGVNFRPVPFDHVRILRREDIFDIFPLQT